MLKSKAILPYNWLQIQKRLDKSENVQEYKGVIVLFIINYQFHVNIFKKCTRETAKCLLITYSSDKLYTCMRHIIDFGKCYFTFGKIKRKCRVKNNENPSTWLTKDSVNSRERYILTEL